MIIWIFLIAGIVCLAGFVMMFVIIKSRNSSERENYDTVVNFDPEKQYAVIRSSICTGEKVAGFRNKDDGHFTDVMLIRSPLDEQRFKEIYGIDKIKTEY